MIVTFNQGGKAGTDGCEAEEERKMLQHSCGVGVVVFL